MPERRCSPVYAIYPNRETDQGRKVEEYDNLLRDSITSLRQAHDRKQVASLGLGGGRDFFLPRKPNSPLRRQIRPGNLAGNKTANAQ